VILLISLCPNIFRVESAPPTVPRVVVVPRRGTYCLEPLSCHIPAANDAAVTVTSFSSVDDELRVLLAYSMRKWASPIAKAAGMTRLDPGR
jgi:hypothetical protein